MVPVAFAGQGNNTHKVTSSVLTGRDPVVFTWKEKTPSFSELENFWRDCELSFQQVQFLHQAIKSAGLGLFDKMPSPHSLNHSPTQWVKMLLALQGLKSQKSVEEVAHASFKMVEFFIADMILRDLWTGASAEPWKSAFSSLDEALRIQSVLTMFETSATTRVGEAVQDRFRPMKFFEETKAGFFSERSLEVEADVSRPELWQSEDAFEKEADGVVQTSIENAWHRLGGLATVVDSMHKAHQEAGKVNFWGYHPLYLHDTFHADFDKLVPYGVISHWYNNQLVKSSVWMDPQNKRFFVVPDQAACWGLFDVVSKEQVYNSTPKGSSVNRSAYVGSSLALFALSYRPQALKASGIKEYAHLPKNIRVLHADSMGVGIGAFEVLKHVETRLKAENRGQEPLLRQWIPLRLGMLHGHGLSTHPASVFKGIGGSPVAEAGLMSTHESYVRCSDVLVPVSRFYAGKLRSEEREASEHLSDFPRGFLLPKLHPILNGMSIGQFDITDPKVLGRFAINSATELMPMKRALLERLYQEGVITSPDRPLAIFVGRFATDKGLRLLPEMAKAVVEKGGQFVCMGIPDSGMADLAAFEKEVADPSSPLYGHVKFYKSMAEQSKLLGDTGIKVGTALRSASIVTLVPSFEEPMGLVPLEAMCMSMPIVPLHQGFIDTCRPANMAATDGVERTFKEGANSVAYPGALAWDAQAASDAVRWAFENFVSLDDDQIGEIIMNSRAMVSQNHAWYDKSSGKGVVNEFVDLYKEGAPSHEPLTVMTPRYHPAQMSLKKKIIHSFHSVGVFFKKAMWPIWNLLENLFTGRGSFFNPNDRRRYVD